MDANILAPVIFVIVLILLGVFSEQADATIQALSRQVEQKQEDGFQVDNQYKHFAAPRLGGKYERWKKYMKSRRWQNFKRKVYAAKGNVCERCDTRDGEKHVHHLTYERLENEKLSDVVILCSQCHTDVHTIARRQR